MKKSFFEDDENENFYLKFPKIQNNTEEEVKFEHLKNMEILNQIDLCNSLMKHKKLEKINFLQFIKLFKNNKIP